MFDIIKNVISAGGYKLADIQHKIKKLYILNDITEEQADQLLLMANKGVSPDAERPQVLEMLQSLLSKIEALDLRVKVLESGKDDPEDPEDPEDPDVPKYPAWEPWNGIDDRYQPGSIVTHNGKTWISEFNGQNVWEPGTVDETFWKEYIEE